MRAATSSIMPFVPAIGLEIHVQLLCDTKLFCASPHEWGAPPNRHLCPVCLGLPGALPALNRRAVELGVRAALGLSCTVHQWSGFARKHYFDPDLPKGYQITQYDRPLASGGHLEVGEGRTVRIRRIHLEEDAGRSLDDQVPGVTVVDLNHAGVPLIEIVTEPDLRSPAEARVVLTRLKRTLEYLQVSDCNLEQGSLRVNAYISLRQGDDPFGTPTEIKNLNSFSDLERALEWEIGRQAAMLARGTSVAWQTLFWDAARGEAPLLRDRDGDHDYRYFPEPDLPPLEVGPDWLNRIRRELPELPTARSTRFQASFGLSAEHADLLTGTRELADFFEAVVRAGADAREAASWTLTEVLAAVSAGVTLPDLPVRPVDLSNLLSLLADGTIPRPLARQVWAQMVASGKPPAQIIADQGADPLEG